MPKLQRFVLPAAVLSLCLPSAALGAQDWAKAALAQSPRHGEFVTIHEPGGRNLQTWVVYPEVKEKAPVVVMIHEIFGLTDWARDMADELAGAGYIVVEPDLLSGFGPPAGMTPAAAMPDMPNMPQDHSHMTPPANTGAMFVPLLPGGTATFGGDDNARKAVAMLDAALVTTDLDAAAEYGKKLPAANGKVYVAGFCWGGGKSFLFATHRHDLSGAFVFYGPPPPADLMKTINAPVYGFYAGNDARITATVPQTASDMKAAGKTYDPVTYEGAGHGFMRAGEAPDASPANTAARQAGFRKLVDKLGGLR